MGPGLGIDDVGINSLSMVSQQRKSALGKAVALRILV